MPCKELEEARQLFERAERETDPDRKFAALEEALDLVDDFAGEHPAESPELLFAKNLRRSNLHRLLLQLTDMRNLQINSWFKYIKLLLLRVEPEIASILASEPSLRTAHRKFVALWGDELLKALQRAP